MNDKLLIIAMCVVVLLAVGGEWYMDSVSPAPVAVDATVPVSTLGMRYPLCAPYYGAEEVDLTCLIVEYGVTL